VPFQAGAQLEGVGLAVGRDVGAADHLRLRLELGVDAEQGVVHHGAVVGGHVLRGPDRIEHAQVTLGHHARLARRLLLCACDERCADPGQCGRRKSGRQYFPSGCLH
jgi:hypothetical protein